MREMLQNLMSMSFMRGFHACLGMALRLRYRKLPPVLHRGQVGAHPAAFGGGEVLPGAQVSLWCGERAPMLRGPGISWGSQWCKFSHCVGTRQWRKRVAAGLLLFYLVLSQ